jgi:hypothetical protein
VKVEPPVTTEREGHPPEKLRFITAQALDQSKSFPICADQKVLPVINLDILRLAAWRFDRPSQ